MTDFNLLPMIPEILVALTAMGLLIVGVSRGNETTNVICWAAALVFAMALVLLLSMSWESQAVVNGMFKSDQFIGVVKMLIYLGLITTCVLSVEYLKAEGISRFEYPILIMFAGLGMLLMVSANNFMALYMGLELQSLSLYVLASFHRGTLRSAEAGVKYFILGAVSSGLLLFGISLVYGYSGSLDFDVLKGVFSSFDVMPLGGLIGLVFILAGFAFKISAVPFHMWTPDVYQGAPTSVTAFFAIVPKIAMIALLIRVLYEPFTGIVEQWQQIIYLLSLASMMVGAFAGLAQKNIKRLLAYSSIGNIGYALIGVVAFSAQGVSAVVLYLTIYLVMTVGIFAILLPLRRRDVAIEKMSDLRGISQTNPTISYAMAILLFSMSGIPPLAGFFGKFAIFDAAIAGEFYVLATLGVISSVVAAYYYLRIIKIMFFEDGGDALDHTMGFAERAVLMITIVFVIGFAFKPNLIVESAQGAASVFF